MFTQITQLFKLFKWMFWQDLVKSEKDKSICFQRIE